MLRARKTRCFSRRAAEFSTDLLLRLNQVSGKPRSLG